MGRGRGFATIAGAILAGVLVPGAAEGQALYPATVTSVTSGDTLSARLADGRDVTVRLIGVDAPEPEQCGGSDARAALADLVDGRTVELESDPAVDISDGSNHSRLYVDRDDGVDAGLELLRQGWVAVVEKPRFTRLDAYFDAEETSTSGVWADCDGDFHLTARDRLRELGGEARAFVDRFYRRLSNKQFRAAWQMLGSPVKRRLGYGYQEWRASYRSSLGVASRTTGARPRGNRLAVSVRLRSRDRDTCNGRTVAQRFRGDVVVAPRAGSFRVVKFRIHKTTGHTPRSSKSQCPAPKPRPAPSPSPAPPATDCQGYDPCIPPGPDVDCAGGSGNGPRYTGPVRVTGSDPYGLDSDNDGYGCED